MTTREKIDALEEEWRAWRASFAPRMSFNEWLVDVHIPLITKHAYSDGVAEGFEQGSDRW